MSGVEVAPVLRGAAHRLAARPAVHVGATPASCVPSRLQTAQQQIFYPDHRPIGSVMRVRKMAYEKSAKFRAEHNGRRVEEPRDLADFPE